jgi:hypothetical protein
MNCVERYRRLEVDCGCGGEVFVVGRRKEAGLCFWQCNAVRSVHEDGWQREATRAVVSDVTGRPWVGAVTRNAKSV